MTQISLLYSVAFWVALFMKIPGNHLANKIGAGRSVLLSAILFLLAALFLTFGSRLGAGYSLVVAIIGQSIYLIAASFQEMSTVIAKNAASSDPANVDYIKIMSATGTIYSVISLVAAISMSRLYALNENIPMYICLGFCVNSCILAYFVSKYDTEGAKEAGQARREALPGVKMHSFDKTTLSCLFLSVLFMVIFTVSGDNLKIMIENDLSSVADKNTTVFLFSMLLLSSRIVKIISNLLLYAGRKQKINPERSFFFIATGVVLIAVFGFLNEWGKGYYAIMLSVAAFMIRVLVFDPFRFSIYDFMLKRLKDDNMINVLFAQSAATDLFTALFSSLSTILLKVSGMHSVMQMLLIISIVFAVGYFVFRRNLIRTSGSRRYIKWSKKEVEASDSLMVAVSALLLHYGVVEDFAFTPKKLEKRISSVEDIGRISNSIQFDNYYDYSEEGLEKLFNGGHPCAIRAVVKENESDRWLPVMYLDNDGGLVWNPYSEERFLAQLYEIKEICALTVV